MRQPRTPDTITDTEAFRQLDLIPPILKALGAAGYAAPTEIQSRAIPPLLSGLDLLGTAQTGGGKTAAFVLPILQRITIDRSLSVSNTERSAMAERSRGGSRPYRGPGSPRAVQSNRPGDNRRGEDRRGSSGHPPVPAAPLALILVPTRELAVQISASIDGYGAHLSLKHIAIFGGASRNTQIRELRRSPQIVVATPGRLLDLVQDSELTLDCVQYLVLDEADRLLDMGFIPDVRRIVAMTPTRRQTAMFSATMPREIVDLSASILRDPVRIECSGGSMRVRSIEQSVLFVEQPDKLSLLTHLIQRHQMYKAIVFTRTKHRASRLAKALSKQNIDTEAIHGDKTQNARTRALEGFRSGKVQVLVATDVAARGLDIDSVSHVINFELPAVADAETYVHRIGRTGRAGSSGSAMSLCSRDEVQSLRAIERLIQHPVAVNSDHEFHFDVQPEVRHTGPRRDRPGGRPGSRTGGRHGERPRIESRRHEPDHERNGKRRNARGR